MAAIFYGISFNITGFGLNIYLTHFTYASIEIPAKVSVYYLLDKVGRRPIMVGTLLMAAVCLGINTVIPKGKHYTVLLIKLLRFRKEREVTMMQGIFFITATCKNDSSRVFVALSCLQICQLSEQL